MANPMWQVRVSPELDAKVEAIAEMMGLGKMEVIRFAVAQYAGTILGTMDRMTGSEVIQRAIDRFNEKEGEQSLSSGNREVPELGTFFPARY